MRKEIAHDNEDPREDSMLMKLRGMVSRSMRALPDRIGRLRSIALALLVVIGHAGEAGAITRDAPKTPPPTPATADGAANPIMLLRAGRFAELDARMSAVQADWRRGRIDDLALLAAFRPFGDEDPALAAQYDAWVKAFPKSYVARLTQGEYEMHVGREARGGELAASTPSSRFETMDAANMRATQALRASLSLDERPLLSYSLLIDLTRHHGDEDYARRLLDAGLRLDPHGYILRLRYMTTLETRWGGSVRAMQSFLAECRAAKLDDAKLRTLEAMVERDRGWVADNAGDIEGADRHDLAAVELAGDGRFLDKATHSSLLATAGYEEERMKHLNRASDLYGRAIAVLPEDGWAWGHLGYCQAKLGLAASGAQAYHRGAEFGDPYAQNEWGKVLWFGVAPVKADRAAAIPWFEKAAASGLPDAVNNLAWGRKLLATQR
jgi:tetratricopeptide (TPR) repeat protein